MSYMCHNELFPDFPRCFSGINPPALSRQHRSLLSLVLAGIRMQIMRNCPPVKLHIYESERRGLGVQEVPRVKSNHKWENAQESTSTCTNCRGAQWQATHLHFHWKRCRRSFQCNVKNQHIMSLSSVIGIRWGQKTGERFVSITFTTHPQNSLSFCLLYGEMMTCNTNNYFSTLLISSDTFSREGKRQFSVFSRMSLHGIGVSLLDDCV